jgi:hypothetical protein
MNNSLPAELAAVVDANHSENMAQSALMQAQMEKSMLMTQTGFFDKKKVPRKKTSQGTRYSEATSFSEVAAALAKYARAVSEKDRVCKERDNADPNKLSLSPITYPDDALR